MPPVLPRRQLLGAAAALGLLPAMPRPAAAQGTPAQGTGAQETGAQGTGARGAPTRMALAPQGEPFGFERLIEAAQALAGRPYVEPPRPDPALVERIDYDAYGKIRFNPDDALFPDGPFPVTLMHVGRYFPKTVRMYLVENGQARQIVYNPAYFLMPEDHVARQLGHEPSAFAGFWLREPASRGDWTKLEPWATCLGASYWRAIGELGQVGLSSRGVAVNPGGTGPEEFPDFVAHWFEPAASASEPVIVHSLLDGPSLAGAYRFAFRRTGGVEIEVEKHLFLRRPIARLGIAPLTSMFWYGEHDRKEREDWRPEVHDSDGLALWTGGDERIWRPLNNPGAITTSTFLDQTPRGFGLSQRDRDFEHYLDGVGYEKRPSCWVEPLGDWGRGAVQLVEIPTDDEVYDNVVAMWLPDGSTRAGDALTYRYRQHWQTDEPFWPPGLARVVATRIGRGGEPGQARPPGQVRFVVELAGPVLEELWGWKVQAAPVVTVSRGRIGRSFMEPVPNTRRWRVVFDLDPQGGDPVELRLFVKAGERALSETWLYQFRPAA